MLALVRVGTREAAHHLQTLMMALRGMFLWSWLVYWLIAGAWQAYQYYGPTSRASFEWRD